MFATRKAVAVARRALTAQEKAEIWQRYGSGESLRSIGRSLGRSLWHIRTYVKTTGGKRPVATRLSGLRLSLAEREEISRGLAAGESCRMIARRIHRAPSTISREVARNGGRQGYRGCEAQRAARSRARRPKSAKLSLLPRLRELVEAKLKLRWSPQQIAAWLVRAYPDDRELRVSHETIYLSLFVQPRGALRKQLTRYLRTRRTLRRPGVARQVTGKGQGQLRNAVHISERPAEADDRAVPGHWEGDLLLGTKNSAMVTLVERSSRFSVLIGLPNGRSSEAVLDALKERTATLPEQLVRSLTWDQGKEMAEHARFTIDTGLQIYVCDPNSPWQRGTNENTNGLLRDYFPKGTSLAAISQGKLDAVAAELNGRPRQTLGWKTPSEKFAEAVAITP
jgi:IS30 family transposase